MPHITPNNSFKNEATRRFYGFLSRLIKEKKMTVAEVADAFGRSSTNPSQFLNKLKTGSAGVTVDDIQFAFDKLGLSPAYLFGEQTAFNVAAVAEDQPEVYGANTLDIGEQLHEIFRKHKTNIKSYAENELKYSENQLHKIFRGESRPYFDTILKVCEDHAESLDLFRRKPLPKGHLLTTIRMLESLVEEKDKRLALLEKKKS